MSKKVVGEDRAIWDELPTALMEGGCYRPRAFAVTNELGEPLDDLAGVIYSFREVCVPELNTQLHVLHNYFDRIRDAIAELEEAD